MLDIEGMKDLLKLSTLERWNVKTENTSYIGLFQTIVNRIDGLETHWNNNITHYLC